MPRIAEPIRIEVKHRKGIFVAAAAYRVGEGKRRVRTGSGTCPAEAVERLLRAFKNAGHGGKRYETKGLEPALRGAVGQPRRRMAKQVEPELMTGGEPWAA